MQWLIDLIIEAIGVPPCYVNRGTHPSWDWNLDDLTADGFYHDLDLSGIVPAGASAVNLHCVCSTAVITDVFFLRPKSITNVFGSCTLRPQVANHTYCVRRAWGCDADRIFTYRFTGAGWISTKINVKGWWL